MGKGPTQIFLHRDGHYAHEKTLSISGQEAEAPNSHSDVSLL